MNLRGSLIKLDKTTWATVVVVVAAVAVVRPLTHVVLLEQFTLRWNKTDQIALTFALITNLVVSFAAIFQIKKIIWKVQKPKLEVNYNVFAEKYWNTFLGFYDMSKKV